MDLFSTPPSCVSADPSSWCAQVWNSTHISWLADLTNWDWLVAKPFKIAVIVVIALIIRILLHRMIKRLTSGNGKGKRPAILRPLRERAPQTTSAPLLNERRGQRARTIGSVLTSIVSFVVWGIAFVLVLGEFGLDLTPIIASAGVIGVAVGFGAQNLVKDFLSGMFMLLEDQYGVGDVVDLGAATGTVESVGLRITTVRDVAGTVWYVRNGEVKRVGNSSQGFAVAVVDIPVGYATDVNETLNLLEEVATKATAETPLLNDVLDAPQVLGVQGMTNDAITLRLTVKVRPARQWAAQRELRRRIMAALDHKIVEPPTGRLVPVSISADPADNGSDEGGTEGED
ncbi:MAG TPA: mechanosensitive ion channel family protein [Pseudonocardiaceae bacterium]|nr:mechanosensitive ion channel family protein [Pseudonocardiaceae bacterium]